MVHELHALHYDCIGEEGFFFFTIFSSCSTAGGYFSTPGLHSSPITLSLSHLRKRHWRSTSSGWARVWSGPRRVEEIHNNIIIAVRVAIVE